MGGSLQSFSELDSLILRQFIPAVNGKIVAAVGASVLFHELGELRIAEGSDVIHRQRRSSRF